ncbi:hypothetical protein DL93DRAFT_2087897, partial [Clavulina sp. PMI_390]
VTMSPSLPTPSLSSRSASYGLPTPITQNAPLLSVDPPHGGSGGLGTLPQGTTLSSTIQYNAGRPGPYARLASAENRQI